MDKLFDCSKNLEKNLQHFDKINALDNSKYSISEPDAVEALKKLNVSVRKVTFFDLMKDKHADLHIVKLFLCIPRIAGAVIDDVTPLMVAVEESNIEMVSILRNYDNVNIHYENSRGLSAFTNAMLMGPELLILFLNSTMLDRNKIVNKLTPLIYSVTHDETYVVKLMLGSDIDVNGTTCDGLTALSVAAQNGYTDIVNLLLECPDVNVNMMDNLGYTALAFAAHFDHHDSVKALMTHPNIDVNSKNNNGDSVLHIACINNSIKSTKLLVVNDLVDIYIGDRNGFIPFTQSLLNKHGDIVDIFMNIPGFNVNNTNIHECTPLMTVSAYGTCEMVKKLLTYDNVDINAVSKYGNTAIMGAVMENNISTVLHLTYLEGLNVGCINHKGNTLLILSVRTCNFMLVNVLLNVHGKILLKFDVKNDERDNAMDIADDTHDYSMIGVLSMER